MLLNRRGMGPIAFILLMLFLVFIMWPVVIAPLFNTAGNEAVASGATGLDAFVWSNWNLWFFVMIVVVIVAYMTFRE